MTTIKDVANLAGVSVATVSRVINERGYVHADTRKKVEEAVKQLSFSPNEVARSLYKRKSKLIGLLLPDIANPYFPQLARGVEDRMQEQEFRLIFGNSDEDEQKEKDYIQTFIQNNVVGVISSTNYPHSSIYENLKIPVVFLDRTPLDSPSVYADGREGGRLAAREIIKRGSRRITVMQGPAHIKPAQDRFEGAIESILEAGLDYRVIQTTSFSFNDVGLWADELLASTVIRMELLRVMISRLWRCCTRHCESEKSSGRYADYWLRRYPNEQPAIARLVDHSPTGIRDGKRSRRFANQTCGTSSHRKQTHTIACQFH